MMYPPVMGVMNKIAKLIIFAALLCAAQISAFARECVPQTSCSAVQLARSIINKNSTLTPKDNAQAVILAEQLWRTRNDNSGPNLTTDIIVYYHEQLQNGQLSETSKMIAFTVLWRMYQQVLYDDIEVYIRFRESRIPILQRRTDRDFSQTILKMEEEIMASRLEQSQRPLHLEMLEEILFSDAGRFRAYYIKLIDAKLVTRASVQDLLSDIDDRVRLDPQAWTADIRVLLHKTYPQGKNRRIHMTSLGQVSNVYPTHVYYVDQAATPAPQHLLDFLQKHETDKILLKDDILHVLNRPDWESINAAIHVILLHDDLRRDPDIIERLKVLKASHPLSHVRIAANFALSDKLYTPRQTHPNHYSHTYMPSYEALDDMNGARKKCGLQGLKTTEDFAQLESLYPKAFVPSMRPKAVLKIDDGWLVGFDFLQQAGGLILLSGEGSTERRLLSQQVAGLSRASGGDGVWVASIWRKDPFFENGMPNSLLLSRLRKENGDYSLSLARRLPLTPTRITTLANDDMLIEFDTKPAKSEFPGGAQIFQSERAFTVFNDTSKRIVARWPNYEPHPPLIWTAGGVLQSACE